VQSMARFNKSTNQKLHKEFYIEGITEPYFRHQPRQYNLDYLYDEEEKKEKPH